MVIIIDMDEVDRKNGAIEVTQMAIVTDDDFCEPGVFIFSWKLLLLNRMRAGNWRWDSINVFIE